MAGPLAGYRIIEIAGIGPGPFCAMMLADMGADVMRVDRAERASGRPVDAAPTRRARTAAAARSASTSRTPTASRRVLELVEQADALIEGFRPGVMERLGLGPDECLARNPKLVFGRMTGWGQDGPYAQAAGHDINYIALAGALGPHRPRGRGAGAAAQPGRRLRRRRHVPRLRRGVRAARSAEVGQGPGRRRRDGRRRGGPDDDVPRLPGHRHVGRDERGTNLLDTGAHFYDVYEAPTASTSRSARSSRSSTPSCCASPGSTDDPEFAQQMDRTSGRR